MRSDSWKSTSLAALLLVLWATAAAAQTTRIDRLSAAVRVVIGTAGTFGSTSPLEVDGLPTRVSGESVVFIHSDGNVYKGTLARADLPSALAYEDEANAFTLTNTFAAAVQSAGSGTTYSSRTTGWQISAAGVGDLRALFVDELQAKRFITDLEQALAGSQIISKSVAIIHTAFTCPTTSNTSALTVRDLPSGAGIRVFADNDWIVMRTETRIAGGITIADCVGRVVLDTTYGTSGFLAGTSTTPATQRYTFTRGGNVGAACTGTAGSSGASTSTVAAEDLALDFGVSGNGYAEVSAVDGTSGSKSPYYQLVTWTTCPVAANRTVEARFGHLSGTHGYADGSNIYGVVSGRATGTYTTMDPVDGFRVLSAGTTLVQFDTLGAGYLYGGLTISTNGYLRSGQTAFETGNGYWFDVSGGNGRFSVGAGSVGGTGSQRGIAWDGTNLRVSATNMWLTGDLVMYGDDIDVQFAGVFDLINSNASGTVRLGAPQGVTLSTGTPSLSPETDDGPTLGTSAKRWENINLELDDNAAPGYVVVNKGGGGGDATTALGYFIGGDSGTFRFNGECWTIDVGLWDDVVPCPESETHDPWDSDLVALAALSSTGIAVRTGSGTWDVRTITGTATEIDVTNGNGVSGNPTLALPDAVRMAAVFPASNSTTAWQVRKADATTVVVNVDTTNSNVGIRASSFGTSAVGVLGIGNGTAPSTSPADMVQLYAADVSASSELHVRDEAGNDTVLSPHNFAWIPEGPSEALAWSFVSSRDGRYVAVDMLRVVRLVEALTGATLVHQGEVR